MVGTITRVASGLYAIVAGEDGRLFTVYRDSFRGQQAKLTVGDIVRFRPDGRDGDFATDLQTTPYCRWQDPDGAWGPLLWRERLPRGAWGRYLWDVARQNMSACAVEGITLSDIERGTTA